MNMQFPDFEARFAEYMRDRLKTAGEADQAKLLDNIEELYADWEKTVLLEGKTAAEYFSDMNVGRAAAALRHYCAQDKNPPQALLAVLRDYPMELNDILRDEGAVKAAREIALDLLLELNDAQAVAFCKQGIIENPNHPLANSWHHALKQTEEMEALRAWALAEYEGACRETKLRLLDFIAEIPDAKAKDLALSFFIREEEHIPYAAEILARVADIGDETVLNALYARLDADIGYLAQKEIAYAIEALGGFLPEDMVFSEDADYSYLASLKDDH